VRDWSRGAAWIWVGMRTCWRWDPRPVALRHQSQGWAYEVTGPCTSVLIRAYTAKRWDQVLTTVDPMRGQSMGSAASFRHDVFDLVDGFRSRIGRSAGRFALVCEETGLCIRPSRHYTTRVLPRGVAHDAASVPSGDSYGLWPRARDHYRPDRRWRWLHSRVAAQLGPARNAWHA
jgi:hypothetical protein